MSLGVILLLIFFLENKSIWFYPRSLGYLISGLVTQAMLGMGSILEWVEWARVGLKSVRYWLCFATTALAYLSGRTPL